MSGIFLFAEMFFCVGFEANQDREEFIAFFCEGVANRVFIDGLGLATDEAELLHFF